MKKIDPRILFFSFIGAAALCIVLFALAITAQSIPLAVLAVFAFIGSFALLAVYCRCPYCRAPFPKRGNLADPRCGLCGHDVAAYYKSINNPKI